MRVVAERTGRALGLPHRRRLRRVTRHGVAGAGAVLRGHLPVFHDLLDLGSFVLKPDFHLGGGTKAHVTGTLRGHPRLPQGGDWRLPRNAQAAQPWRLPAARGLGPRLRLRQKAWLPGPRGRPGGAQAVSLQPAAARARPRGRCLLFGPGAGRRREGPRRARTSRPAQAARKERGGQSQQNNDPSPARLGRGAGCARARELVEVEQRFPQSPSRLRSPSLHLRERSESACGSAWRSNILYSSRGVGVGVKGMGPCKEDFPGQQRPPPRDLQAEAQRSAAAPAAAGGDPSAFLARGNVLGLPAA